MGHDLWVASPTTTWNQALDLDFSFYDLWAKNLTVNIFYSFPVAPFVFYF